MQKFRASNHVSFGGFLLLLVLAIVAGAALGGVLFAVDYYIHFYLVLLFPIVAGAIAGGLLARGVYSAKVRSPFVAFIVGLVCGVLIFAVYHGLSYYIGFRNEVKGFYVEDFGEEPTDAELNEYIDFGLQDAVDDTGFVGYMKLVADQGFSITRTASTSSSSGIDLQGNAVFAYWGVEILIAALFAAFIAARAAGEPFNEDANEWYGPAMYFATTNAKGRKEFLNALKDGNFQQAGAMLTTQDIKYPRLDVNIRRTRDGGNSQDTYLQVVYNQRRGRSSGVVKQGMLSPSDFESLQRGMAQGAQNTTFTS
ncbi:MAG: hypothetical protein IT321_08985 [Anaerolineae bacterium]|nr:hypothetical protein [Anaerolineae bacterium]